MAVAGTITGNITTDNRHWKVVISGITNGATSPSFIGKGYSNSSFVMSVTGTAPTNIQPQGSNDAGTTWVNIGVAPTSFPAGGTLTPNQVNFGHYQYVVSGGDSTTSILITTDFSSQNAS